LIFWEVDILGVDISGVDILGVDILRVDILGGTLPADAYKSRKSKFSANHMLF